MVARWPAARGHRWIFQDILVPFITTRVMLTLVGCIALSSLPGVPLPAGAWELKADGQRADVVGQLSPATHPILNVWSRWDAAWYHDIAKNGYSFAPGQQSNTAFFPIYPLLMKAVYFLLPGDRDATFFLAGCVVSNAALVVALYYLVLLVRIDFDHRTAARTVLYLLVCPSTLFLSAVYTESVFLATTVAAFYYARNNRWVLAGLLAGAATVTRSAGFLLAAPLLLEYLAQRRWQWREIRPNIAALAIIPAAAVLHMLYLKQRVGNMMAMSEAQAAWGGAWGKLTPPWATAARLLRESMQFPELTNFGFVFAAIALIVFAAVRLRATYSVYAVLCFCFVTSWGTFDSVPRYVLMIFPVFIALAILGRNRAFHQTYLLIASGLAAFLMIRFALWQWVA
jgi:hypothetical protein